MSAGGFGTAIANAEGFGVPGAIPTLANNPGDLKIGDVGYGTTSGGITIFGSIQDGFAALSNQVAKMFNGTSSVYNPNQTIGQVGDLYSGGDPSWAQNVAAQLGVSVGTTLSQLGGLDPVLGAAGSVAGSLYGPQMVNGITAATGSGSLLKWLTPSNVGMFVVGAVFLIAGLASFKGTQTVIQSATKVAAKGAEVLA